jgi:anti-sigma factor RsiW
VTRSDAACPETLTRISAYLDQELDSETCSRIEAHCRVCAPCARLVEGLQAAVGLCQAAGARPLPPALKAKARANIERLLNDNINKS